MIETDQKLLETYVLGLRGRPQTIREKTAAARAFMDWLDTRSCSMAACTVDELNLYMGIIEADSWVWTKDNAPLVIRELFDAHYAGAALAANPVARWNYHGSARARQSVARKAFTAPRYIFSVAELDQIFEASRAKAHGENPDLRASILRTLATAELVYASGLEAADIAKLRMQQLDAASDGVLHIESKFGTRMVSITPAALEAISKWRDAAANYGTPPEEVFYSLKSLRAASPKNIADQVHRLGEKLLVKGSENLSISSLRQTFAAHMLDAGADHDILAYALGLKQLSGIQKYITSWQNTVDAA